MFHYGTTSRIGVGIIMHLLYAYEARILISKIIAHCGKGERKYRSKMKMCVQCQDKLEKAHNWLLKYER